MDGDGFVNFFEIGDEIVNPRTVVAAAAAGQTGAQDNAEYETEQQDTEEHGSAQTNEHDTPAEQSTRIDAEEEALPHMNANTGTAYAEPVAEEPVTEGLVAAAEEEKPAEGSPKKGALSADELDEHEVVLKFERMRFAKADADGDGKLSPAEFPVWRRGEMPEVDALHDAHVLKNHATQHIIAGDSNDDGALDENELQTMFGWLQDFTHPQHLKDHLDEL